MSWEKGCSRGWTYGIQNWVSPLRGSTVYCRRPSAVDRNTVEHQAADEISAQGNTEGVRCTALSLLLFETGPGRAMRLWGLLMWSSCKIKNVPILHLPTLNWIADCRVACRTGLSSCLIQLGLEDKSLSCKGIVCSSAGVSMYCIHKDSGVQVKGIRRAEGVR